MHLFSGLTRDVEESQSVFAENDGFSILVRVMQTGDEKLQTKAAFMMKAMCISRPEFKGTCLLFKFTDGNRLLCGYIRKHSNGYDCQVLKV